MLFVPKKKRIEARKKLMAETMEEIRQRHAKTLKELREADKQKHQKKY